MYGSSAAMREIKSALQSRRVVIDDVFSDRGALDAIKRRPDAPIVVHDPGQLDEALRLVSALDKRARRPIVVVVSPDLDRGLAALGWKASTHRIGFVRAKSAVADFDAALDDLLPNEPEPEFIAD